jgi:Na+/melibiose symporter-like transporter
MGHAVPPERRAFLMSRRWMFLGIAKLVSLPLASQLIDRLPFPRGYQIVYGANFAVALGAFACATQIRVRQKETGKARTPSPPGLGGLRNAVSELAQAKSFTVFVIGRSGLNLGLALVSAIIPIYWVSHLNASDTWVGYFAFTLSAATLVSYPVWTRLKRRYGTKWILRASVLGSALYPALLSLARSPAAVLPVVAFNGTIVAGLNLAFFDALLDTCPRDRQERFVAINLTAVNLMGVIAPPIGAALLGLLTIRWVMWIGTLVALGGVAVFVFANTGRRGSHAPHRGGTQP